MAPRPFPSVLNIGTDIVLLPRLVHVLSKDPVRFLRRVFTPREHSAFKSRFEKELEGYLSRSREARQEGDKRFKSAKVVEFIGGR